MWSPYKEFLLQFSNCSASKSRYQDCSSLPSSPKYRNVVRTKRKGLIAKIQMNGNLADSVKLREITLISAPSKILIRIIFGGVWEAVNGRNSSMVLDHDDHKLDRLMILAILTKFWQILLLKLIVIKRWFQSVQEMPFWGFYTNSGCCEYY